MRLTEAILKQMIVETMENSNPEIESQIERTSAAIHLYEIGELTNLDALTHSLIKGMVGSIRGGSAYASATVEFKRKAEELGVLDQVTAAVLALTKEDTSPEIRLKEELLKEDAKGPRDLPEDVYVKVFHMGPDKNLITVMFTDKDGRYLPPFDASGEDKPIYGDVTFRLKSNTYGRFDCDNSAVIAITEVAHGWGPMLYDIAMEISTMKANGLTPDRTQVSPAAQDVWDIYSKFRPDVKAHQLDNEYNELTPEDSDNCVQFMSRERAYDYGGEWKDNALSKRFTKAPTTINQIRDKLIWEI